MRIAILLTSNDTSEFSRRFPDDGQKFISLLQPLRPNWEYKVYSVMEDDFPASADAYDGYIITGSPASVHDGHPWIAQLLDLIRDIEGQSIPMVGACFGHQAIALALGGSVSKSPDGWVVGTASTKILKQFDWMEPAVDVLTLHAAHKEHVSELPQGTRTIGIGEACPHAAFALGNHIMTTQYHPEMPRRFMDELIEEMGEELTPEAAELGHQQIAFGHEGDIFASWMVNFLEMRR